MTYTYAILEISEAAYNEIAGKMLDAGYDVRLHNEGRGSREVIDMQGIAVQAAEPVPIEEAKLIALKMDDQGIDFTMKHPIVPIIAEQLADAFKDAGGVNCVTWEINHVGLGPLVLTMQRRFGETPGQQASERLAALQEIDALVSQTIERPHAALGQIQNIAKRAIRKAAGLAPA